MDRLFSKLRSYGSFFSQVSCDPRRLRALRRARRLVAGFTPYQAVPFPGFEDIQFERPSGKRMELMLQNLEFEPTSFLDIGCNVGYFCFRFHQLFESLTAVGVDKNPDAVAAAEAIANACGVDHVRFSVREFGSGDDLALPRSDVVCCLSLLHHIFGLRGREAGLTTLRHLRELTLKVMFFEIGSSVETDASWARGLGDSLPGGDDELSELVEAAGFSQPMVVGEEASHLAPVARKIWAARA